MTARLFHIWHVLTSPQSVWLALWLGLAAITVGLLVLMRTRWGETKPLGKCTLLSVLAHLLLAAYLSTVQLYRGNGAAPQELVVRVTQIDGSQFDDDEPSPQPPVETPPWEVFDSPAADVPAEAKLAKAEPAPPADLEREPRFDSDPLPGELPVADLPNDPAPLDQPTDTPGFDLAPREASDTPAAPIDAPAAERREAPTANPVAAAPLDRPAMEIPDLDIPPAPAPMSASAATDSALAPPQLADAPNTTAPAEAMAGANDAPSMPSAPAPSTEVVPFAPLERLSAAPQSDANGAPSVATASLPGGAESTAGGALAPESLADRPLLDAGQNAPSADDIPAILRDRVAPDRASVVQQHGGSPQSEAAVNDALAWLARNQSDDGRWDAKRHGAGRETQIDGRNRGGAGARADTGVTGLALLAFLGAAHTHTSGDHRDTVADGLDYLLRVQRVDGNLGGSAETYALMYCHGMATLALSEAYALTRDVRLAEPVRKAVGYTLRAQNRSTGGWRYQPGDLGDTSQLGWQLMALKSAELGGVAVDREAREGAARFLRSVSAGPKGGLASYRPGERPSRPMTAEALVCKQFLGLPPNAVADGEAAHFVLEERPGASADNYYYWYYATLALFQLQGQPWEQWNAALQTTLVGSQRHDGDAAGSWDPRDTWGPHGGRVYSTAMAALCLEVYYRYLPVYGHGPMHHARRPADK